MAQRDTSKTSLALDLAARPKLLLVAAPYQADIVEMLVDGAQMAIEKHADFDRIDVTGALEIPTTIRMAAAADKFDGFVALGCIMRGDTSHYDIVCRESARGLTLLGATGVCVGNGILTVENEEQAICRADPKQMDKGGEAARAALHLIAISHKFLGVAGNVGFRLHGTNKPG